MLEGLPPNRPTHVLRLVTDERSARAMADLVGEAFEPAEVAVAAFEAEDGRSWLVEAYFAERPDEAATRALVRTVVGGAADEIAFASFDETDWVAASLAGLGAVRAGRFIIHGAHDRAAVRANDWAIEIEAALAFGTGHHGTTKGCLLALAQEAKRRRPRRILDVGTGSGVLAIAAAKALKRPVTAGDIDAQAVTIARDNARLNGVLRWTTFYTAPGVRPRDASRTRGFDLVMANILAGPLRRLAPALTRVMSGDGTLILSGLLPRDVPGVLAAYRAQGTSLRERRDLEGWSTLVLTRGGAGRRRASLRTR